VPAPPKPLWLIPSPIKAHRRETTKTDKAAQATAMGSGGDEREEHVVG